MIKLFSFNKKMLWIILLLVAVFAPKLLVFFFIGAVILSVLPALIGVVGLWYVRHRIRKATVNNHFSDHFNPSNKKNKASANYKYNPDSFTAEQKSKSEGTIIDCENFSVVDEKGKSSNRKNNNRL